MKSLKKLNYGDPICIRWSDTTGTGGWTSLHDEPLKPVTVDQLGYYVFHDASSLHIAQGIPQEGDCQVLAPTVFPLGCILDVTKVKI